MNNIIFIHTHTSTFLIKLLFSFLFFSEIHLFYSKEVSEQDVATMFNNKLRVYFDHKLGRSCRQIPKEKIIIRRDSSSSGPSVAYETIAYLMLLRI
jgi:hypothetical protein